MVTFTTDAAEAANRDLERRVVSFLAGRHLPALRNLQVEARGGIVALRGRVRTFHEKQLAQQCGRRVAGVIRVLDDVQVEPIQPRRSNPASRALDLRERLER